MPFEGLIVLHLFADLLLEVDLKVLFNLCMQVHPNDLKLLINPGEGLCNHLLRLKRLLKLVVKALLLHVFKLLEMTLKALLNDLEPLVNQINEGLLKHLVLDLQVLLKVKRDLISISS